MLQVNSNMRAKVDHLLDNFDIIKKNVSVKERANALLLFIDWIAFNLIIGNNDSHSKNISLLLVNRKLTLAPFYDLLSTGIYPRLNNEFSFVIGERTKFSTIGKKQFLDLDKKLGLKDGTFEEHLSAMSAKLKLHKDALVSEMEMNFSKNTMAGRISSLIDKRIKSLKQQGLSID